MPRVLSATVACLALWASALTACSTPCDASRVCTLDGQGQLCDGNAFIACGAANANERVQCGHNSGVSVCTPGGWTFQSSP